MIMCVLQVWWRWEDDSAWSDSLLSDIQTSFPIMLWEGASEEQMADTLSVYQVIVIQTYCTLSLTACLARVSQL